MPVMVKHTIYYIFIDTIVFKWKDLKLYQKKGNKKKKKSKSTNIIWIKKTAGKAGIGSSRPLLPLAWEKSHMESERKVRVWEDFFTECGYSLLTVGRNDLMQVAFPCVKDNLRTTQWNDHKRCSYVLGDCVDHPGNTGSHGSDGQMHKHDAITNVQSHVLNKPWLTDEVQGEIQVRSKWDSGEVQGEIQGETQVTSRVSCRWQSGEVQDKIQVRSRGSFKVRYSCNSRWGTGEVQGEVQVRLRVRSKMRYRWGPGWGPRLESRWGTTAIQREVQMRSSVRSSGWRSSNKRGLEVSNLLCY